MFRFLLLLHSIVLVEDGGGCHVQSDAVLRMGRLLGGPVGLVLLPGVIVPKVCDLRDANTVPQRVVLAYYPAVGSRQEVGRDHMPTWKSHYGSYVGDYDS